MEVKLTIDWLKEQFENDSDTTFHNLNWDRFDELFEQAKKMDKLEKEFEYRRGFQDGKQYYKEEYGNKR